MNRILAYRPIKSYIECYIIDTIYGTIYDLWNNTRDVHCYKDLINEKYICFIDARETFEKRGVRFRQYKLGSITAEDLSFSVDKYEYTDNIIYLYNCVINPDFYNYLKIDRNMCILDKGREMDITNNNAFNYAVLRHMFINNKMNHLIASNKRLKLTSTVRERLTEDNFSFINNIFLKMADRIRIFR